MKKPLCLPAILVIATNCCVSPMASAEPLTDALTECRQQQNALKRLVCYDKISLATATLPPANAATSSALQAPAKAPVQSATGSARPATTASAAGDDFGLAHTKKAEQQTDQLYLIVSSVSYSPRKELIVGFDNGQIWRQTGSDYYKITVGERHYIKRGLFNSFSLGNDDNNRTVKVRRVE